MHIFKDILWLPKGLAAKVYRTFAPFASLFQVSSKNCSVCSPCLNFFGERGFLPTDKWTPSMWSLHLMIGWALPGVVKLCPTLVNVSVILLYGERLLALVFWIMKIVEILEGGFYG